MVFAYKGSERIRVFGRFGVKKCDEHVIIKENPLDAETYPYYSGEVVAEKEVYLPQPKANGRVYISLRNGNYASAEVFVNGISAGKKFVFPAFFDVSEYRGRKISVAVKMKNTLFPLLGPLDIPSYSELKWVEPRTFEDEALKGTEKKVKFDTGEIAIITVDGR